MLVHDRCQSADFDRCLRFCRSPCCDLAARRTSFNTHTERPGRSNLEHLAAPVERVRDPVQRAMGELACVLSDAGSARFSRASGGDGHPGHTDAVAVMPARSRLTTSHSSCRLRYRSLFTLLRISLQSPVSSQVNLPRPFGESELVTVCW